MILLSQLAPSDHLLGMKSKRRTISLAEFVERHGRCAGKVEPSTSGTRLACMSGKSGRVSDVLKGGVADKAALGPGMLIVAVNGRAYTPDVLKAAIHDAKDSGPALELIVENTGFYKVIRLDYHGGERYPQLERVSSVARPARGRHFETGGKIMVR